MIGEKGKAQLQRDSKKSIHMVITETQKMPISYMQARIHGWIFIVFKPKKHGILGNIHGVVYVIFADIHDC